MDGVALIEEAQKVGLNLAVVAGKLVVKGPRRLESLAKLIIVHKDAVITALQRSDLSPSRQGMGHSHGVGVTETSVKPENSAGFADSGRSRRRSKVPVKSLPPPLEIVADPIVLCPRCSTKRVLPELRTLTGDLCYPCWEGSRK
jgi:hypothetical protein